MTNLHISPALALPLDGFVTSTQMIVARKRRGKSYLAQKQAEELLVREGQPHAVRGPAMTAKEWAETYLYEAYNVAEHADRLVQIARHELQGGRVDAALATLRQALDPAESAPMRIRDAIEKLEGLRDAE